MSFILNPRRSLKTVQPSLASQNLPRSSPRRRSLPRKRSPLLSTSISTVWLRVSPKSRPLPATTPTCKPPKSASAGSNATMLLSPSALSSAWRLPTKVTAPNGCGRCPELRDLAESQEAAHPEGRRLLPRRCHRQGLQSFRSEGACESAHRFLPLELRHQPPRRISRTISRCLAPRTRLLLRSPHERCGLGGHARALPPAG